MSWMQGLVRLGQRRDHPLPRGWELGRVALTPSAVEGRTWSGGIEYLGTAIPKQAAHAAWLLLNAYSEIEMGSG